MKYVPAPAVDKIRIHNIHGVPMFNGVEEDVDSPDAGKPKPFFVTYQEFLRTRTADEAFFEAGGKKEGIDALELQQLARAQIKATEGVTGAHVFDDEVAKRLRQAIIKPKGARGFILGPELEHNLYDWVMLWKAEPRHRPPTVLNSDPDPTVEEPS